METLCRWRMSFPAVVSYETATSLGKWLHGTPTRRLSSTCNSHTHRTFATPRFLTLPTSCETKFSRTLYTKESLSIDKYEVQRERTAQTLGNMMSKFSERMKLYLDANEHAPVFTEDLKNMAYVADSDADLELLKRMLERYHKQNAQMRFSSFTFGPIIMRLYHLRNKPDLALEQLFSPELEGFFDQISSYQVAMDLLFENKRYDDVLRVYDQLLQRNFYINRFPHECAMLAAASCYCLDTPEAFQKIKEIITKCNDSGGITSRRALTIASHMALKHDDPAYAIEILNLSPTKGYVSVVNLRCLGLTRIGRVEDCLMQMREVAERNRMPEAKTGFFARDVLAEIKKKTDELNDEELKRSFDNLYKALQDCNEIGDMTMEEMLLQPIDKRPRFPQAAVDRTQGAHEFDRSRYGRSSVEPRVPFYQRQGGGGGYQQQQQQRSGQGGYSDGGRYQPRGSGRSDSNYDADDGDGFGGGRGQQRSGGFGAQQQQQRQWRPRGQQQSFGSGMDEDDVGSSEAPRSRVGGGGGGAYGQQRQRTPYQSDYDNSSSSEGGQFGRRFSNTRTGIYGGSGEGGQARRYEQQQGGGTSSRGFSKEIGGESGGTPY